MIRPVTLVVCCTGCASEATIKFEDADSRDFTEEAVWQCPRCQTSHRLGVVGRIAWTIKQRIEPTRQGPDDGSGRAGS